MYITSVVQKETCTVHAMDANRRSPGALPQSRQGGPAAHAVAHVAGLEIQIPSADVAPQFWMHKRPISFLVRVYVGSDLSNFGRDDPLKHHFAEAEVTKDIGNS